MSGLEEQLVALLREYPGLSKEVERCIALNGTVESWPSDVLLPYGAWMAIYHDYHGDPPVWEQATGALPLAAIGTWRYSKGIYRFPKNLYDALVSTELPKTLPMRVFRRLPDWCPYLELPEPLEDGTYGYYCHLDHDPRSRAWELRIYPDKGAVDHVIPLELTEGIELGDTIATYRTKEAAEKMLGVAITDKMVDKYHENALKAITPPLSMLLYLCSDEPEIDDEREPGTSPSYNYPKKIKGSLRLFEPPKVRTWDVGKKVEAQIVYAGVHKGGKKAPHIRRAHWHGYWTGPRTGQQEFSYHWMPPMAVAVESASTKEGA